MKVIKKKANNKVIEYIYSVINKNIFDYLRQLRQLNK